MVDQGFHGHAAFGEHLILAGLRPIEHPGRIREHNRLDSHHVADPFDFLHVRRFHITGDDVDLIDLMPVGLGKIVHHGLGHAGKSGHMSPHITRGVHMDDEFAAGDFAVRFGFANNLRNVIADGFRQTGRVHRYNVGFVDGEDVVDGLHQVGLSAEHRCAFSEGTGRGHHRLFVMAGEGAPVVGAATLRAMTVRQTTMNAQSRVHGAYRLAGLGRVDGQGFAIR